MYSLLCTYKKPVFWLVREGDEEKSARVRNSESCTGDNDCFGTLSAIAESLVNILEEDIREGIPPHAEDVELLKILKQNLVFLQEQYCAAKKEENV